MKRNILLGIYIAVPALFMLACSCLGRKGNTPSAELTEAITARQGPVQYTYVVKNVYPHSTDSYTQGLYWHDGYLWEGTGQKGESALKQVELETGRVVKNIPMGREYFGEGIALLNGSIYQLTWNDETGFIYDAATLERTGTFSYRGEGWGLTTDGQVLYMSDGTDRIYVVDPEGFTRKSVINVTMEGRRLPYLNELEWIDGKLWANVYTSEALAIIDPATGVVEGIVDLTHILPEEDVTRKTDVLNGIAYDPEGGRIFVTGKYWNKLFEIEIRER